MDVLLFTFGLTAFVLLFMGPVMWSSDNEFMFVRLWRWLRRRPKAAPEKPARSSADPRAPREPGDPAT